MLVVEASSSASAKAEIGNFKYLSCGYSLVQVMICSRFRQAVSLYFESSAPDPLQSQFVRTSQNSRSPAHNHIFNGSAKIQWTSALHKDLSYMEKMHLSQRDFLPKIALHKTNIILTT